MDFNLNEQEKMLQRTAHDFAVKSVAPAASEIDRTGNFPYDLVKEMGRLGFHGLPYPAQHGGSGAGYLSFALVLEQICQASFTVGAIISVNTVTEESLYRFGNEKQKKQYLVPLAQGNFLSCIAFTETETGSDPREITSTSRKSDAGYVISGQKQFVSAAGAAKIAMVFAKSENEGLNAFLVDTSTKGFNIRETCETMGARGFGTSVVTLDDIFVPRENLLGEEGKGFGILLEAIAVERMAVAVQAIGVAQAGLDIALSYARERKALGKPITRLLTIQWHLAEMAARIDAGRWLAYHTAFMLDQGQDIKPESSKAKLFCSAAAVDVTRMAMQITGAYGTMTSMPVERLYRDAKMTEIYVGVSEIQRRIIAEQMI